MATVANGKSVYRTVICPKCLAEPGQMCVRLRFGTSWYERAAYHVARKVRYHRLMNEMANPTSK
jgi:hypothetical protein